MKYLIPSYHSIEGLGLYFFQVELTRKLSISKSTLNKSINRKACSTKSKTLVMEFVSKYLP